MAYREHSRSAAAFGVSLRPMAPTRPLSVIIPAFNAERWLAACVQSCLAQDYAALQLVIVDDASTDSTRELAAHFAASDGRVSLVAHASNRGVAGARSTGVEHATGEYLLFLDADDLLAADALGPLMQRVGTESLDAIVGAWTNFESER